jgi:hypothetical protein
MLSLRQHWHKAALFVLLSLADLALTCHLLAAGGGEVYEANWLAGWALDRHGLTGLAVLKGLLMLLPIALVGVVAAYRPRLAGWLATFGCVAVGLVVLYSAALWSHLTIHPWLPLQTDYATARQQGRELDRHMQRSVAFRVLLERWGGDLAADRCTLREAVAGLSASDLGGDPAFLRGFRQALHARSDAECLAALAVSSARTLLRADGSGEARVEKLLAAYRAEYGPAAPLPEDPIALVTASNPRGGRPEGWGGWRRLGGRPGVGPGWHPPGDRGGRPRPERPRGQGM